MLRVLLRRSRHLHRPVRRRERSRRRDLRSTVLRLRRPLGPRPALRCRSRKTGRPSPRSEDRSQAAGHPPRACSDPGLRQTAMLPERRSPRSAAPCARPSSAESGHRDRSTGAAAPRVAAVPFLAARPDASGRQTGWDRPAALAAGAPAAGSAGPCRGRSAAAAGGLLDRLPGVRVEARAVRQAGVLIVAVGGLAKELSGEVFDGRLFGCWPPCCWAICWMAGRYSAICPATSLNCESCDCICSKTRGSAPCGACGALSAGWAPCGVGSLVWGSGAAAGALSAPNGVVTG
jgi:hypothetical protein